MSSAHTQSQNRFDWVDANKGLAIMIVVLYHVTIGLEKAGVMPLTNELHYAWRAMTAVATPVFFIMSGYFVERSLLKSGISKFLKVSLGFILYPYFLWSIVQESTKIIFARFVNTSVDGYDMVALFFEPSAQFWFLHALFCAQVLFVIFYSFMNKHHCLLASFCFVLSWLVVDVVVVADAIRSFAFVLFGAWMAREKKVPDWITSVHVVLVSLCFYLLSVWFYQEIMTPLGFNGRTNFIGGIAGTFLISALFITCYAPGFLLVLGRSSMYIFVFHIMCLVPVRVVYNMLPVDSVALLIIASTVAGLVIPVMIGMVMEYIGIPRYLGFKEVGFYRFGKMRNNFLQVNANS